MKKASTCGVSMQLSHRMDNKNRFLILEGDIGKVIGKVVEEKIRTICE